MDRAKQLGVESVGKLLFQFSLPAIIGMLVQAFYNMIDRIFVGKGVGALALSGVGITFPFFSIGIAFGMLVGIGAGALVSIRLGQQKREEAEEILGNAFVLLILVSLFVTAVCLSFLDVLLRAFGASDAVLPYAKDFITIILLGTVLQNLAFGLNSIIRAEGSPKIAMYTMLIGVFLNCILNPIFIFVLHMGVKGSALATVLSQVVSMLWVVSFFRSGKSSLKLRMKNLRLKKELVLGIFSIGMSPFSMQLAASVVMMIMNKNLGLYGGDMAIGAMGVITSIAMLFWMPIFGINQGSQPIIGYNYGAKEFKRVKRALGLAILAATGISMTGFLLIEIFPHALIGIFSKDSKLVETGSHGIRIFLAMIPIIGFQVVSANYFQAVGKAKIAMFLSLLRQVILLIPLVLILPIFLHLDGVWLAAPIADFISSLITAAFLYRELRNLQGQHEELINAEELA